MLKSMTIFFFEFYFRIRAEKELQKAKVNSYLYFLQFS